MFKIDQNLDNWGGKAVFLSQLGKHGFNIPVGFVIPSNIFEDYINDRLDFLELESILDTALNKYINNTHNIIFRSSANIEGVKENCCCGVFNSFIYDKNESLLENVKKIWDSVFDLSAQNYFRLMSIDIKTIKMAVLVQEIKIGVLSGVVQTFDMVNNIDRIILEYETGSVNAVVNGCNNAELLLFDKRCNLIQGICPTNVSFQCFHELVKQCIEIENIFSMPTEVEFQLFENKTYIIQARKLT